MLNKYIRFTGDYGKLKSMGFGFQRLFAGNYMQWCNKNTRVWKRGTEVTHDRLTNFEGAFLELYLATDDLPIDDRGHLRVFTDRENDSVSFDQQAWIDEGRARMKDPENDKLYNHDVVYLSSVDLEPLGELIDLGWVEVAEF